MLRTIIASADRKGTSVFLHFSDAKQEDIKQGAKNLDLNKIMQNVGGFESTVVELFAAYDTDPRVKTMVANFSEKGIEPKTKETIQSDTPQQDAEGDKVAQMAKSATNLGDIL